MADLQKHKKPGVPPAGNRKTEYQSGYQAVLIREDLKSQIRQWRTDRHLNDSHIERCLTSALVELGLQAVNEPRLLELLGLAVSKDFELSSRHSARTKNLAEMQGRLD